MLIVVAGFAVWYLTGRESSLIMGSGLVLATGGGLREAAGQILDRLPRYEPPPAELPHSQERPRQGYEHRHEGYPGYEDPDL
jgi:hypothetical protein